MTYRSPRRLPAPYLANRHFERGLNLIEIMVSMTIGLFLVLGATTLYIKTKKNSDVDDSIARLQETARYALNVIETDVRMANYWGLVKDASQITNRESQSPGAADSPSVLAAGKADTCGALFIDPETYIGASNNGYTLTCAAKTGAVTTADTLIVRRVDTDTNTAADERFQICSSRHEARLTLGENAACPTTAEYHDLLVHAYYVDQQSDNNSNYPALRRWTLVNGPSLSDVEIIPGVEDMQIELGWDNDASTSLTTAADAVRYVQPGDAILTNASGFPSGRIVAVRVWLLIRAEQQDATFTDGNTYTYGDRAAYTPGDNYRRLLVSRTFFVRNVNRSN